MVGQYRSPPSKSVGDLKEGRQGYHLSGKSEQLIGRALSQPAKAWNLILEKLDLILDKLKSIEGNETVKDWYSIEEAAIIFGKAPFTVREWCRQGRINAKKKKSGRGKYQAWVISHDELLRIQREGLL